MRGAGRIRERYCPEIDFAVGPFNTSLNDADIRAVNPRYDALLRRHNTLIGSLHDLDKTLEQNEVANLGRDGRVQAECLWLLSVERPPELKPNRNSRCFLAVKMEKKTGEKRVLGGIVHASGLGKVGVVVTNDDIGKYRSMMKVRRYLRFLIAVGRAGSPPGVTLEKNTILLPRAKFLQVLQDYQPPPGEVE